MGGSAAGAPPVIVHSNHRDVTMVAVSRAPYEKLAAFEKRMGWRFKWLSSGGTDFNFDFQVAFSPEEVAAKKAEYNFTVQDPNAPEREGISVFFKDESGKVFRTYSAYARGLDMTNTAYHYLDLVPKGRDEGTRGPFWVRRHDEYDRYGTPTPSRWGRNPRHAPGAGAFSAVTRPFIDLLGDVQAITDCEREDVHRRRRDEQSARSAELGAAELQIDRRAPADGAHDVERREPIGLDELLVAEETARRELDLVRAYLAETELLERALDGLAEQAVRVRVDGRRGAGLARDGDERPPALALPVRDPPAALAVR